MTNANRMFRKSFGILTIIGLFSLFLGSLLISPTNVNADVIPVSGTLSITNSICIGQQAHLTWSSVNATSTSIDQGVGSVSPSGDIYVSPTVTTTYTMTATNSSGGYGTASATVYVTGSCATPTPTPIPTPLTVTASIYSNHSSICIGQSTYLSWTTNNATQAFINQFGTVSLYSGSQSISPSQTTTYTVTATNNQGGSAVASTTVFVTGSCYTPTPTPTNLYLNIQKFAKNISRGETANSTSVNASSNQTIEFDIIVTTFNSGTANNIIVTDLLPAGLTYVNNSTSLNGNIIVNGIISSGINIGSLGSNQQALIKLFATVDTIPAGQSRNMINTSQVRADNLSTANSNQVNVNVGQGVVLGALSIKTGASSALYISLFAGLLSTLGFYYYKTRIV